MPDIHAVSEHPLPTSTPLLVRVLGPLEVRHGSVLVDLGSPKQRALFLALLLQRGHVVNVDSLVELLWDGHPPRTAGHSLQIYVSELRRRLVRRRCRRHHRDPTSRLPHRGRRRRRRRRPVRRAGARGSRPARQRRRGRRADPAGRALTVWRGEPLAGAGLEELTGHQVARWEELHLEALEQLAAARLENGDATGALSAAESAIQLDAFRERGRELVMLALYRSGRVSDALRSFARFRALLVDELGIEPSPVLQRLQERILTHDPALLPGLPPATPIRRRHGAQPVQGSAPVRRGGRSRLLRP